MRFLMTVALAVVVLAPAASGSATRGAARPGSWGVAPPVTVDLGEFFYRPGTVTVHVGQRVRFVNVGRIEHTVADTDAKGRIRSTLIRPRPLAHGQVQVVTFRRPGTVRYLCTFHPTLMKGTIRVVR
jgi:plastocyanin